MASISLGIIVFFTSSIVQYSKEHDISESVCLHPQVRELGSPILFGPIERANISNTTLYNIPETYYVLSVVCTYCSV
jgi:hypothetical protein